MTSIYIITNTINSKVYVGQTSRSVHTRYTEHMRDPESALFADVSKYGKYVFTYKIIHMCKSEFSDQWEHYYICKYNATNPDFGYNRVPDRAFRWVRGGINPSSTDSGKERIRKYNLAHIDSITSGFKVYNNSRKFPVGMLDSNGDIIIKFESLADACRYLKKPLCGTSRIKQVCDTFKKNGSRRKFYGYAWTALDKNVQTNCKMEDELPSE